MNDLASYAEAQRRLLESTWGQRVISFRSAAAEANEAETAEDGSRTRIPITSSDLNGDGRHDVVFFDIVRDENSHMSDVSLTAHDGRTGARLWTQNYGLPYDLYVLSPGDVTGDGAADLFAVEEDRVNSDQDLACTQAACTFNDRVDITWTMTLISGPDGSTSWTDVRAGSIRYLGGHTGQGPGLVVARRTEAVNALIDIRRAGDTDGDGLADLAINFQSYAGEIFKSILLSYEPMEYASDAYVVSGRTGQRILSRTASAESAMPLLVPTSDLTGDGSDDLLWTTYELLQSPRVCTVPTGCASVRTLKMVVEVVDGATGEAGWNATLADAGLTGARPLLASSDLTGDAKNDVIVGLEFDDGSEQAVALSGADGSELWRVDTILTDPPTALGSSGDVLLWEGWYPTAQEAPGVLFRIRLRRIDGATGEQILATQHDLAETERVGIIYAYPLGDLDDDGIADIAHASWDYSSGENGSAYTLLRAESGQDGREILRSERDRKALLFTGGDLDGDGTADLLEGSAAYNDSDLRLAGLRMPAGDTLWSRTDVLFSGLFGVLPGQGQLAENVVYGRTKFADAAPRWRSRVDVFQGATGERLWGVGSPMGDAPVRATLRLTNTAAVVDHGDVLGIETMLSDADGTPLVNREVRIAIGDKALAARTDEYGLARVVHTVRDSPGSYEVSATFEGAKDLSPASDRASITVRRELPVLWLSLEGRKNLTAHLMDDGLPLAGKQIVLSVAGRLISTRTSDENGRGRWLLPKWAKGKRTYKALFAGDQIYRRVEATLKPRG